MIQTHQKKTYIQLYYVQIPIFIKIGNNFNRSKALKCYFTLENEQKIDNILSFYPFIYTMEGISITSLCLKYKNNCMFMQAQPLLSL